MGLRPVQSLKHVITNSGTVVAGAVTTQTVIEAVDNPTLAGAIQVQQGSTVSSIFLSVEVVGAIAYAGVPRFFMAVMKNPGNNITSPRADTIGTSDAKKQIIHQEMIMVSQQASSAGGGDFTFPRTMFKGVIRIPRGYKRFGTNDRLNLLFSNDAGETTGSTRWCIQCIYKEFK